MNKIKTLCKYIKNMDFKNMLKIVKKVSKKSGKLRIIIFLDMVYCGLIYGAGYYDYQEFEFYKLKRKQRKTYLTRTKNNSIIRRYNNKEKHIKFDDKEKFNKLFKKFIKRDYLVVDAKKYKEFSEFIKKHSEFIAKPVDGVGGFGVEKIVIDKKTKKKELFNKLIENNQCLLEELIIQHSEISKLYNGAVNTLRIFTFYDGKNAHIVNSVFKIGNGGVTDNFSSGSMYTFVDEEEGIVIVPAIDQKDKRYTIHPISKKNIIGFEVPLYDEAVQMVKEAAKVIPDVKYVGWDVAITEFGAVLIEGNSFPGVYQIKPSFTHHKNGLIPKYKKVMKIK